MERKNYYITGGILLIGGLIYFLSRGSKRRKLVMELEEGRGEDKSIIPQETQQVNYANIFPLKKGSGYNSYTVRTMVKNVQRYINQYSPQGSQLVIVDGLFGEETERHLYAVTRKKEVSKDDYQTMI